MEEEIDKISGLPDPVLHHILSLLPTKYSVRTSILSSRWRHLWASVPVLRFDQKDFIVKPHFMDFVEGILFFRDWSLPVQKVRLRCYDGAEFFRTTTWIRVLSRRPGLQELDLGAHPNPLDLHALPAELFRLKSLVKLKLNLHCHCSLVVPSVIHLNNLKCLHLKWVQFDDDHSVARLLSGCPQLEELTIEECNRVPLHNLVILGHFLKMFTMIETTNEEDDYYDYEDEVHGCALTIDAPNLVMMNCCIGIPPTVVVGSLPCIESADINLKSHDRDVNYGHITCELLKGVCETKVLKLSNSSMEYMSLVKDLPDRLTAFNKLKHLKLTKVCLTKAHIWVMFVILKNSPYLESLSFTICEDTCWIGRNQLVDSKNISSSDIFRNLETLEIGNFKGIQREFGILKFMLVNAKSLRSLNITLKDIPRDTLEQMRIRGRLMKYLSSTPSIALRLF